MQLFHTLLAILYTTKKNDLVMVWTAMMLAFFGFLRLGELTCHSKVSAEIHLAFNNVKFSPHQISTDFMTLVIKASKTDPFRFGHTTTIEKTGLPFVPFWP